ncbi:56 kDa type-specific antigen, partial [Frankliniella fusca]
DTGRFVLLPSPHAWDRPADGTRWFLVVRRLRAHAVPDGGGRLAQRRPSPGLQSDLGAALQADKKLDRHGRTGTSRGYRSGRPMRARRSVLAPFPQPGEDDPLRSGQLGTDDGNRWNTLLSKPPGAQLQLPMVFLQDNPGSDFTCSCACLDGDNINLANSHPKVVTKTSVDCV